MFGKSNKDNPRGMMRPGVNRNALVPISMLDQYAAQLVVPARPPQGNEIFPEHVHMLFQMLGSVRPRRRRLPRKHHLNNRVAREVPCSSKKSECGSECFQILTRIFGEGLINKNNLICIVQKMLDERIIEEFSIDRDCRRCKGYLLMRMDAHPGMVETLKRPDVTCRIYYWLKELHSEQHS